MSGFFSKKVFLFVFSGLIISLPFLVFSQEISDTESIPSDPVEDVAENTETSITDPESTNQQQEESTSSEEQITQENPSTNTDQPQAEEQSYFIDNSKPEEERVVQKANITDQSYFQENKKSDENSSETTESSSEVLGESTIENTEEPIINQPEETVKAEEIKVEPIKQEPVKKAEKEIPLSELTRVYEKKVFVNKDAKHTCEAEFFSVDMSQKDSTINTIFFTKESEIPYEMEIGSLPIGIDIRFAENNSYYKNLGSTEESIDIKITKNSDAVKGNFTIPIIYTQKGVFDSAVVCQINILNI